jgi:Hypoxia induced protein conserved region
LISRSHTFREPCFVAKDRTKMHSATNLIVAIGVGAVTIALLFGLINMLRGGNSNRSQMLMRWRVGLQFAVIVIIMGVLWFRG